jgi:hypothetical protein
MPSIDLRTRNRGDAIELDVDTFRTGHLAAALESRAGEAGTAALDAQLAPLTLVVDGQPITFDVGSDGRLRVRSSTGDALVVHTDRAGFSDLMQDVVSTVWLTVSGRGTVTTGTVAQFLPWEPVLRCLLDARPVYRPGSIAFTDLSGAPMNPRQSFRVDEDPQVLGHFLAQTGYLHLREVFTAGEMATVSADLDAAIAAAHREDGNSWWARTADDHWYPARILAFNEKSAALRDLLRDERYLSIGRITDDDMESADPRHGDVAAGLLKKVGVVEGISDLDWHKDCTGGNHSRTCCSLVVGISVTGAGPDNGQIGVVPGSHRANIDPNQHGRLDLPNVDLPTTTGDITVHCTCTIHRSCPPVNAERRVVYAGFRLAPRSGDREEHTEAQTRRDRVRQNDHVRRWQRENTPV